MRLIQFSFTLCFILSIPLYAQQWQERLSITAEAPTNTDWDIMDTDGKWAVVGAPDATVNFSSGAGEVMIYELDTCGVWTHIQTIHANDPAARARFGLSVAISDSTILVGAYEREAAYIFQRNGNGTWSQTQKLSASDGEQDDKFGWALDLDGDYAVISSKYDDHGNGASFIEKGGSIYIFRKGSNGIWSEEQKLTPPDNQSLDYFGYAVSLEDSTVLAGSIFHKLDTAGQNSILDAGAGYIFSKKSSGTWTFDQKLVSVHRTSGDQMGRTLALASGKAVLGLYKHDYGSSLGQFCIKCGCVVVFEKDPSGVWHETSRVSASDWAEDDQFGSAVSFDGERLVVGAMGKELDENGLNPLTKAGAAYVFKWDTAAHEFVEQKRLVQRNRMISGNFGRCVMVNGNEVMVASTVSYNTSQIGVYREAVKYEQWDTITSCGPIVWIDGNTYAQAGDTASFMLQQANGCDSLVHLYLARPPLDTTLTLSGGTLVSNAAGGTYQWLDCTTNQAIPNAIDSFYTPTQNGSYAVIINKNGCVDTSSCFVMDNFSLGENVLNIDIYPNPTSGYLNINGDVSSGATWELLQLEGKSIRRGVLTEGPIDLSGLAPGVYFISVSWGEKRAFSKLVKL